MWITRNLELLVLPVGVVYDYVQYGSGTAKKFSGAVVW